MRLLRGLLLLAVIAVSAVGATSASGAIAAAPTLRVAPAGNLTVVGSGFAPRTLVRLHVVGAGIDRRVSVRAGAGGGFVLRLAGIERCSADGVTATTASGGRVRVPTAWFVRECPPPPPLAPGVYAVD